MSRIIEDFNSNNSNAHFDLGQIVDVYRDNLRLLEHSSAILDEYN